LEDLEGVGEKIAGALRDAGFNTPENILNSSIEEIMKAEGIGEKTAEKIFKSAQKLLKPEIIAEAEPESEEPVSAEATEGKEIAEEKSEAIS